MDLIASQEAAVSYDQDESQSEPTDALVEPVLPAETENKFQNAISIWRGMLLEQSCLRKPN